MRVSRSVKYILLYGVLLAAFLLRFYALDASSLWSDEGNTWALMPRSFAQIARDAAADIHPPGYYWLLKLWTSVVGTSAYAMRSLSALLGVALVALIYRLGRRMEVTLVHRADVRNQSAISLYALTAALVAAYNAFQVYYSQEARMYMLLAVESALLFWALLLLMRNDHQQRRAPWLPAILYVASGSAGLWTHYSFPVVLAAAVAVYLLQWIGQWRADARSGESAGGTLAQLLHFGLLNGFVLLLFAPWLPTAIRRVLQWPAGGDSVSLADGLHLTLQTLLFGPLRNMNQPAAAWLIVAGLPPLLGSLALIRRLFTDQQPAVNAPEAPQRHPRPMQIGVIAAPIIWLLTPMLLMFGLGLFSDAFLKFLLVASPAWCLLAATITWLFPPRWWQHAALIAVSIIAIAAAGIALPGYYNDPQARDNYAGVAQYIEAQPPALQPDLIVLDAPGQREVWAYYDPGVPILALPQERPADPQRTIRALEDALAEHQSVAASDSSFRIFALFWATDEADPDRLVETWLDQNTFKTVDSWQGNLRFVSYQVPDALACSTFDSPPFFGDQIQLRATCQPAHLQSVPAGGAAILGLIWRTMESLDQSYAVTVQLLDARNQVIAQRDGIPAGGSKPTTSWRPDTEVADNHGISIPFGTPPGSYRLIVALYDPITGERLSIGDADHLEVGDVEVVRPPAQIPTEIIPMQHRVDQQVGSVRLLGYNLYKEGFAHAPDTPIQPGEMMHVTFFWQAPDPLPTDWPSDLLFTLRLGNYEIQAPLAGSSYPTGAWQRGELVRGEFSIPFDGEGHFPRLYIESTSRRLTAVPE